MEYSALALFTQRIWWWPLGLLLLTAWFWRQTLRNKRGASEILKITLVLNAAMAGFLYFSGSLASGFSSWLALSPFWSGICTHTLAFIFFLMALLWLLDAVLGRTALALPRNAWAAVTVIVLCTLAFLFPALEWLAGNLFPNAQSFGLGGVPLLIFSAALLGGSRPRTWLGRGLLILIFLSACDAGLASSVTGRHWHYLLALAVSSGALIYTWIKPRFIELSAKA